MFVFSSSSFFLENCDQFLSLFTSFVCLHAYFSLVFCVPHRTTSHVALSFFFVCIIILYGYKSCCCFFSLSLVSFIYVHENVDNIPAKNILCIAECIDISINISGMHARVASTLANNNSSWYSVFFSVFIRQCVIICVIA